jgi:hypothetical protein
VRIEVRALRIFPLYAMSALLAVGLVLVAGARNWGGGQTIVAGAIVAFIYLAAVVVPWLLADLGKRRLDQSGVIRIVLNDIEVTPPNGHHGTPRLTTEGSRTNLTHVTTHVTAG